MAHTTRDGQRYFRCEICQDVFEGYGNNPDPYIDIEEFNDAECCDNCNLLKVIPARIEQLQGGRQ